MLKIVLLGAPGAGKGTQAKVLAEGEQVAHISTGDMLRAAVQSGSDLGARVKTIMEDGQLVPDDVIVELIGERIGEADCENGYILDGFPRTVAQAEALAAMLGNRSEELSHVVLLEVSDEDVKRRLNHRRGQENRKDDSEEVQLERLRVYEKQTAPLIEYYDGKGALLRVNASGTVDEVGASLTAALHGSSA